MQINSYPNHLKPKYDNQVITIQLDKLSKHYTFLYNTVMVDI